MGTVDIKKMKVSDLRAELSKRGMSTEGLKADLVNRLQLRLDEEEFGLAEVPLPSAAALATSPAPVPTPAPTEKEPEKEEKPPLAEPAKATEEPAPDPPEDIPKSEVADETPKESAPPAVKATGNAIDTKGMTLEEKKKARAARFGIVVKPLATTKAASTKKNSRKRERGSRGEGKNAKKNKNEGGRGRGGDKNKKSTEPKTKKNVFDSLSKEELEKRLDRAKKYGVANETVDAMKIALRKFRFEGK